MNGEKIEKPKLIVMEHDIYGNILLRQIPLTELKEHVARVILLNAVVAGSDMYMWAKQTSWDVARDIVDAAKREGIPILSYVGHQSTVQLIREVLGVAVEVSRGLYTPSPKDLALVFRLKGVRPSKEVTDLKAEDVEIWYIHYFS